MIDLEKLKTIAQAATQGEWKLEDGSVNMAAGYWWSESHVPLYLMKERGEEFYLYDAEHIAAFNPTTALELIAEIERLQAELKKVT